MNVPEIIRRCWAVFEPDLAAAGYELVEVEFAKQYGTRLLRVYIDKEEGITHDDCQAVSQLLNPVLDAEDLIEDNYVLEVSSPGFDRPLRKPSDFERYAGEELKLSTHTALLGQQNFRGILRGFQDGLILLQSEGADIEVHIENLKKANLVR